MTVLLRDLADTSAAVAGTSARLGKVGLLADVLGRADPDEAAAAVAFLSGELRQRQIGVGWASLREVPPPADSPTLRVGEVDAIFEEIGRQAGAGSQAARRGAARPTLFGRATAPEQRFLRQLLVGELRQGALEGVMVDAVARAAGVPGKDVRRAVMLRGDLGVVAAAALAGGAAALAGVPARGRPAGAADAGADRGQHRTPRWPSSTRPRQPGRGRVEARRGADPGAPQRDRGRGLHPVAGRHHRPGAGGGGGRARRCR